MPASRRLELGKPVRSSDDEVVGELCDVIIDPIERRVTHLVVKPHEGHGQSRLVEVAQANPDAGDDQHFISLRCTADEVHELPNIEDVAYLRLSDSPVSDPNWDVGVRDVLALPYYESSGMVGYSGGQGVGMVFDRIPKGEVEIRRSSTVFSDDGQYVGDVDGFLVDEDGHITHFVLERGHLWGRREITVPIGAVTKVESDTVTVGFSIDELGRLPTHRVHRWWPFEGKS